MLHAPCGRVYWVGKCCMHLVGGCTGWVSVACTLWEGVLGGWVLHILHGWGNWVVELGGWVNW